MKIYRIEMMDGNSYCNYMGGGYNYKVTYYDVEAKDEKQAVAVAKKDNPSYYINESYVQETSERKHTISEKDHIITRIAELEKELAKAREDLKKFD